MANKIASLILGIDIDKIQNDCSRLNQENTRLKKEFNSLSNTIQSLELQVKQAYKEKEALVNENEIKLKEKEKIISEFSQTISRQQEEYNTLQREYEVVEKHLNTILSAVISIVKFCDYANVSVELSKSVSLHEILSQLENILNKNDIYSIADVGVDFNENIHRVNEIIDTDDESKDLKVCESLKRGFRKGSQCIEPQEVKVTRKGKK